MAELRLNHKLTFHIPLCAYDEAQSIGYKYSPVPFIEFEGELINELESIGIDCYNIVSSVGGYKGRKYDQDLFTVFCDYDHQKAIIDAYKSVCRKMKNEMKQEQYAYEHDGVLIVFEVE